MNQVPDLGVLVLGDMEHADCILCGQCIDNCKQKVITYSFGRQIFLVGPDTKAYK